MKVDLLFGSRFIENDLHKLCRFFREAIYPFEFQENIF